MNTSRFSNAATAQSTKASVTESITKDAMNARAFMTLKPEEQWAVQVTLAIIPFKVGGIDWTLRIYRSHPWQNAVCGTNAKTHVAYLALNDGWALKLTDMTLAIAHRLFPKHLLALAFDPMSVVELGKAIIRATKDLGMVVPCNHPMDKALVDLVISADQLERRTSEDSDHEMASRLALDFEKDPKYSSPFRDHRAWFEEEMHEMQLEMLDIVGVAVLRNMHPTSHPKLPRVCRFLLSLSNDEFLALHNAWAQKQFKRKRRPLDIFGYLKLAAQILNVKTDIKLDETV